MNIQQFHYVLAVVENENFERAAEACFVTQSTLSTMINRFESEIGIKIFNRKTKPLTITNEGVSIIQQIRIVKKEIDSLNNVVQELKGEEVGELRIGIIPTIATDLLPLFLSKFADSFPKIKLIIQEMRTFDLQKALRNRILDIGILATPLNDKSLTEWDLYVEPFLVYDYCSNKEKPALTVDDIDFRKLWLLEEGHCLRTQVQKICDTSYMKKERNIEFKAGSLSSLFSFTKSNKGITILPYLSTLSLSDSDKEKLTPFAKPVPVRSVSLVTHQHFVKTKLLDHLQKIIKNAVLQLNFSDTEIKILPPK